MNQDFLAEKDGMIQKQKTLQQELERLGTVDENHSGLALHIRELLKFDPMPRELLVLAVEKIEIGEKGPDTGLQAVQIHWKF